MSDAVTGSQTADLVFGDRSDRSTRAVQRLVALKDKGPFPGARKADPAIRNSTILIPTAEVKAYIASKNKKAK